MKKLEPKNYIIYQGKVNKQGRFDFIKEIATVDLKDKAFKIFNKVKKKIRWRIIRNRGEYIETAIYSMRDNCYLIHFVN